MRKSGITTTEDVWNGTAVEKQIHDSTALRMSQNTVDDSHEAPIDYGTNLAAALAAVEKQLTGDMNAMHELRSQIEATPTHTKAEARIKVAVYERIGKHIFESQQGHRAPVVDGNAMRVAQALHNSSASAKRALEIERLKLVRLSVGDVGEDVFAPILAESVSRLPKVHKNICRTPRETLLADSNCREHLNVLLKLAADAEIEKLQLFPLTNVADRIAELKQCLDSNIHTDGVDEIQAELNKLRAPEADDIATRHRRKVTAKREAAQDFANRLVAWAIRSLEAMHAEALAFERAMFSDLHLSPEETVVSRRFRQVIGELRQLQTPLRVLNWFGMPSLTHVAEQLESATP